ncbi:MAG TPA: thrombospondin type 3 repeat-containing protein [Candidatus Eisenbacteria bacterium]|nr:thrombospondin type 3 repeat-containing protein [Candidatus Eisenbacteria bacterium]
MQPEGEATVLRLGFSFLVGAVLLGSPCAHAQTTYNLAGYGAGIAGSTNGADGFPATPPGAIWTNGDVTGYVGGLPVQWYALMTDGVTPRVVQTGNGASPAPESLLGQVSAYNAVHDPDLATDRVLAVGGRSWTDPANGDQGWGHGLDYGLIHFAPLDAVLGGGPVYVAVTVDDDPANTAPMRLAFAMYGGWDTNASSERHQTYTTSPHPVDDPLGSAGLKLLDYRVASTSGETVSTTFRLQSDHDGKYTLFVGALDGVAGRYRVTITPGVAPADADGDGVADDLDDCPGAADPDQRDTDGDGVGDACDPFPTDPENDLAQCRADLVTVQARMTSAVPDADGDGRADDHDGCPSTPLGAAVDQVGCSRAEFCASFDATTPAGRRACRKADWKNDEPVMTKKGADCAVAKGRSGGRTLHCVATDAP